MIMRSSALAGLTVAGLMSTGAIFTAIPAEAFILFDGNVIVDLFDVGDSFDVIFDQGGDLKATGTFRVSSFDSGVSTFAITLTNTSTVASKLTSLGFNTEPGFALLQSPINPPWASNSWGKAETNTSFAAAGRRDVCFFDASLSGCTFQEFGRLFGILSGRSLSFSASLDFRASRLLDFTMSDFAVHFKEVESDGGGLGRTVTGRAVPTPALLPGLIGMGIAALRKRNQEEGDSAEA